MFGMSKVLYVVSKFDIIWELTYIFIYYLENGTKVRYFRDTFQYIQQYTA